MVFYKKSTKNRKILLLSLFSFFFLIFNDQTLAATKAPQFSLPSALDGSQVDMKNYADKVVLVNFFTTWCPPCRQEIPSLNKLQDEYSAKGFSVIGISLDESSSRIVVKFMKKMEINYPVAMADDEVTRDFGGVIGIPTSILVDQKGDIAKRYDGYAPHDLLKRDIDTLLSTK